MGCVSIQLDEALAVLLRRPGRSEADEARELIVTELYRRGAISRGKAADVLGMSLETFLRYAGKLGIPYIDFTEAEWEAEKRAVQETAATLPRFATQAR